VTPSPLKLNTGRCWYTMEGIERMVRTFKVMVDGATGTGKSCYIQRHRTGTFEKAHIATVGVYICPLTFYTTSGPVVFKLWDMAGDERDGSRNAYYQGAQAILAFYDLSRPETAEYALERIKGHPELPAVLCGNKADTTGATAFDHSRAPGVPHYPISARSNYNFEKPFLALARVLMRNPLLEFVGAPAQIPPTAPVLMPPEAAPARVSDTLEVIKGVGRFSEKYTLGPDDNYDGFGEPLRDDLEGLLDAAGREGYTASITVTVKLSKT